MKIYLDFDGICVEHEYPRIGRCNFGCMEVIKKLQDAGHEIILNTYRSDCANGTLEVALQWLNEWNWRFLKDREWAREFTLKPISATSEKIHPLYWSWDYINSKQEMFIDDIASGIPLKPCVMVTGNMVDWDELNKQFIEHKIY